MFLLLSKIVGLFVLPSTLLFATFLLGALLAATAWRRLALSLVVVALSAILVFGLLPVSDLILQPLENRFPRPAPSFDPASAAGIIVLGGVLDGAGLSRGEVGGLNEAAERVTEAVVLARRYPGLRIIFSGGSGGWIEFPPEAELIKDVLVALGLDEARLTLESQSRSTHENAVLTAQLLQPRPEQTWLLMTSAAHIPRSVGSFRKAGFKVVAWPVDYRTGQDVSLMSLNRSFLEGLVVLDNAAHEYLGLLGYYLTGRTDALFPAP
jgi:uncharacterized SAM-binding protein YcdF (DUF218 family)